MDYVSITGITLGVAVVAVFVIGLLSYMSQLVKNAYQIKVEIRSDMEGGLRKIEEDLGKKAKWMRSEVGEDISKIKQAIEQENTNRLQTIEDRLTSLAQDLDAGSRDERAELRNIIAQLRKRLSAAEQEIAALREEAARRAAISQKRRDDRPRDEAEHAAAPMAETAASSAPPAASPEHGRPEQSGNRPEQSGNRNEFEAVHPTVFGSGATPSVTEPAGNSVVRSGGVQRIQLQDFADKRPA